MISVETLYQKVQDTLAKNQSGYFSNEEFNLNLTLAQNDIYDFYLDMDGASARVHDALQPFLKTLTTTASNPISLPTDYRSKRNAEVQVAMMMDGEPTFNWKPCDFLQTDEGPGVKSSPILGPSVANSSYWFEILEDGIYVYPESFSGNFRMLYLRDPIDAERAVTVNVTTQAEEYDAAGTTDLEWNPQQLNVFHDVISYYQGFQIRESEVVQWLMGRKPLK